MKRSNVAALLISVATLMLVGSTIVLSVLALNSFRNQLSPAIDQKIISVSRSLETHISRAISFGIPIDEMRGVGDTFALVQDENPVIQYLAVLDPEDQVLHYRSRILSEDQQAITTVLNDIEQWPVVRQPLMLDQSVVGYLLVVGNPRYMQSQMTTLLIDIATVLVVSGLVAIEILLFLITFRITAPLQTIREVMAKVRAGDLSHTVEANGSDEVGRFGQVLHRVLEPLHRLYHDLAIKSSAARSFVVDGPLRTHFSERVMFIRPPLFLLIFSESMSLSFFPLYVESLYQPIANIPKEIVIGLPISLFMLIWALSLPFAGQWSDRAGRRRTFVIGALLTGVGLVCTGLAQDMFQLLIARCITAVGYGVVFITAQSYVIDHTAPENRTKGMALFLSGFFSGSLCGAAMGGILADRIGFTTTFYLSAFLSIVSALFVARFLVEHRQTSKPVATDRLKWSDFFAIMTDRYFLVVTFFAAIPAKMALTGFLYYSGPLYLMHLGASQSASGRVLMAYGLAIIIFSPLMAWVADRLSQRRSFIVLGGLLSGLALLGVYWFDNLFGMLAGVALLGTAHAIGVAPQLAVITEAQSKEGSNRPIGKTIGIFRLTERIGNISGPLIAAFLIATFGFRGAFLGMAITILVCAVLFVLFMKLFSYRNQHKWIATGISK